MVSHRVPAVHNRFLQINDLHQQPPGIAHADAGYKGANARARWLFEKAIPDLDPDFVLGLGDFIHGESLPDIENGLAWFKSQIQAVQQPFYPVMGNHEVKQQQGDPVWEAPFRRAFGAVNDTLLYGEILFVMFNNSGTGHGSPQLWRAQFDWLQKTLEQHADMPKILCCHVPLAPIRTAEILAKSFGFRSYYALETEFLDLVNQHAKTTLAVLSGHLHITGMVVQNDIYHICVSGTASYPGDYAVYTLHKDRIDVEMRQVPMPLQEPDATNIHGQRRHGIDYVDEAHTTHQAYLMGNPDERKFSIPLK